MSVEIITNFEEDTKKHVLRLIEKDMESARVYNKNSRLADLSKDNPYMVMLKYTSNAMRFTYTNKQNVFYSKELLKSANYVKFQAQIKYIEQLFKTGGNLIPHMSRLAVGYEKPDYLLNAWQIAHLHFDEYRYTPNKKIKRPGELLYCLIKENDVFFLCVEQHNFENTKYLEIIKNNWPEQMPLIRYDGELTLCTADGAEISPNQSTDFLRNGISTMIQIGGGWYASLISGDGFPTRAVRHCNNIFNNFRRSKQILESNKQNLFRAKIQLLGAPQVPKFNLVWQKPLSAIPVLYDTISGVTLTICREEDKINCYTAHPNKNKVIRTECV